MLIDKSYQGVINPIEQYNGLNNLKKAGVQVELTPEQAEELDKCSNDFDYFLRNYVEIMSLDQGTVPFEPFGYQARAMKKIVSNRFSILRWPRQMGKTTTVAAVLLWYAIFNRKYNIYVLAQQKGQAIEILDRIKEMYELLPWWLQPGVFTWNRGSIQLGNKSRIVTAATGGSGVRGKTVHLLYLDEFAWVENDVEFYTATYPVVSSGERSKIIITSTPNGMNLFYKIWTESIQGKNAYIHDDAHWSENPYRDDRWYKEQMSNMSDRQFKQEFECIGYDTRICLRDKDYVATLPIGLLDELIPNVNSSEIKYLGEDFDLRHEMEYHSGVVYRITRKTDGLSYIGITKDFDTRLKSHLRSPKFKGHEVDWDILFEGSLDQCSDLEETFITKYDTWKNGLNLTPSGKGKHLDSARFNTRGFKYSDESRKKMSEAAKKRIAENGQPGKVFTTESRMKMSESRKGKRWSPLKLSLDDTKKIKEYLVGRTDQETYKTASKELGHSVYLIKKVAEGRYEIG